MPTVLHGLVVDSIGTGVRSGPLGSTIGLSLLCVALLSASRVVCDIIDFEGLLGQPSTRSAEMTLASCASSASILLSGPRMDVDSSSAKARFPCCACRPDSHASDVTDLDGQRCVHFYRTHSVR